MPTYVSDKVKLILAKALKFECHLYCLLNFSSVNCSANQAYSISLAASHHCHDQQKFHQRYRLAKQ